MNKAFLILLLSTVAAFAQTPPAPGTDTPTVTAKPKIVVNSPAWNLKVQAAAKDPTTIKDAFSGMSPDQYTEFAAAVIKAIETLPSDPDLVIADRVAAAAKALIAAAPGQGRTEMIATIFAVTEIAYLPAVAENIAPSFSKSANALNAEAYDAIAKAVLGAISEKTATADNGTARLAIAVSIFESGGGLTPDQTKALVASACPTVPEATRDTATTVANQISSTGSYEGVANLTGVTLSITPTTQQQITQRQQAAAPTPAQEQAPTTPGQQPAPTQEPGPTTEPNNTGAPALTPAVNTPGSTTEGLLGAIGNRGSDSIGTVIGSNTGAASAPGQGGDNQGGSATGGGDVAPPPPPPPPPPTPYQGQGR